MVKVAEAHNFIAALRAGRACLHPTDTLPGLTFDPYSAAAKVNMQTLKGRDEGKPFLGLVASAGLARRFFAPLPGRWEEALDTLWPGPLSVVWQAAPSAPPTLVAEDGTIGLRVPQFSLEAAWMGVVLALLEMPLPTTSVNRSGEPPVRHFTEAATFLQKLPGCYVPPWRPQLEGEALQSTVVRLHADGGFTVLRAGALAESQLEASLQGG